ncbi:MAG: hypothetical protein IPJ97_15810 [Proteobacteria bacterium]|nr:hypothetical protein [Pseudomonadota bacterium]
MRDEIGNPEAENGRQAGRCDQQSNAGNARPNRSDWLEIRIRHESLDPAQRRPTIT